MGLLALVALAGGVAWYLAFRPHPPHSPVAWYARVVSAAVFVGHEQHLSRKHPVTVSFLADGAFQARFGESLAAARPGPGPAGTGLAQYVSSADTIFVRGTSVDFLTRYALVGSWSRHCAASTPAAPTRLRPRPPMSGPYPGPGPDPASRAGPGPLRVSSAADP
jgi:hypothetical protein